MTFTAGFACIRLRHPTPRVECLDDGIFVVPSCLEERLIRAGLKVGRDDDLLAGDLRDRRWRSLSAGASEQQRGGQHHGTDR